MTFSTKKLLFYKALPILIKPLAIFVEFYFSAGTTLVSIIPLVMISMSICSIPVHKDIYNAPDYKLHDRFPKYFTLLIGLLIFGICINLLFLIDSNYDVQTVVLASSFFLLEKLVDESSRYYLFYKHYTKWFILLLLRAIPYIFVPILFLLNANNYIYFVLVILGVMSLTISNSFYSKLKVIKINPLISIKNYLNSFPASASPLIAKGISKYFVTSYFVEFTHLYQMFTYVGQALQILVNVKFLIPFKLAFARKPVFVFNLIKNRIKIFGYVMLLLFFSTVAALLIVGSEILSFTMFAIFESFIFIPITILSSLVLWANHGNKPLFRFFFFPFVYSGIIILLHAKNLLGSELFLSVSMIFQVLFLYHFLSHFNVKRKQSA